MNYYKIEFTTEFSKTLDFKLLMAAVNLQYHKNSWSTDTLPLWIVATPKPLSEFLESVVPASFLKQGVSPAISSEGFEICQLSTIDSFLPVEAQEWIYSRIQAEQQLIDFLNNSPS